MNKPHSKDKKSNASHKVKATPKSFNNSGFRVDSQQSEVVRRRSPAQSCSVLHAHRLNTDLFAHNCWIKAWTYWAIFVLVVHFCCLQNLSHLTNPIMGIFRIQTGVWTKNLKEKPWNKDHTHCNSFVVNKDMFLKTPLFWNKCLGFSVKHMGVYQSQTWSIKTLWSPVHKSWGFAVPFWDWSEFVETLDASRFQGRNQSQFQKTQKYQTLHFFKWPAEGGFWRKLFPVDSIVKTSNFTMK